MRPKCDSAYKRHPQSSDASRVAKEGVGAACGLPPCPVRASPQKAAHTCNSRRHRCMRFPGNCGNHRTDMSHLRKVMRPKSENDQPARAYADRRLGLPCCHSMPCYGKRCVGRRQSRKFGHSLQRLLPQDTQRRVRDGHSIPARHARQTRATSGYGWQMEALWTGRKNG